MPTFVLLAQAANSVSPDDIPKGVFIILCILAGGVVAMTSIIMGFNHATKEREMNHLQRMKALESGILVDEVEDEQRFRRGAFRLAFCIGAVVPIAALGIAAATVSNVAHVSDMFTFLVWSVAGAVGVAGAASGAWLAQGVVARLGPGNYSRQASADSYARRRDPAEANVVR